MANFDVLAISPETKSPENVFCETIEQAQTQTRIARSLGRLFVGIVDSSSPSQREQWQRGARDLIRRLEV
jgi:hypothetical protein